MKAAVVHEFKTPLRLEDVAKPEPGPEQIVVKIEASGLCHTDIHAAHGDWPVKPKLPLIPGHEGIGIVEMVGPGVTKVKELSRVGFFGSGWPTLQARRAATRAPTPLHAAPAPTRGGVSTPKKTYP